MLIRRISGDASDVMYVMCEEEAYESYILKGYMQLN